MDETLTADREESRRQEQRYIDTFPGWRQIHIPRCPRVVAGRRCYAEDGRNVPECICSRYHHRILDHAQVWRAPEGYRVLTAEPYHIDSNDLDEFRRECRELGLGVELFTYSPYSPGNATLLVIRRVGEVVEIGRPWTVN